eukprot:TRINITY_DN17031_c0_g1_i1.p1 TRINITY_DN17031_c0_g1~~TRINITY_DN17031_c0_g1_i1.p1  ORF type:complete len:280 (-),score=70.65 TRINITY_DN17031_c0_g1_i1:78-917(-)
MLHAVSAALGWAYVCCWASCQYPQLVKNFAGRTVAGVSLDYTAANLGGSACWLAYTAALLLPWFGAVQEQFMANHGLDHVPLGLHDLAFAVNSFCIGAVLLGQQFAYRRQSEPAPSSAPGNSSTRTVAFGLAIFLAFCFICSTLGFFSAAFFVEVLGGAKIVCTLAKYAAQVAANSRKVVKGWSALGSWLDFAGALFCLLEMLVLSIDAGNLKPVTSNAPKFGLAAATLVASAVLLYQVGACTPMGRQWRGRKGSKKRKPSPEPAPAVPKSATVPQNWV